MGAHGGPNIVRGDELGVIIDPSSKRSIATDDSINLSDYSTWIAGNSSASGYGRNGDVAENLLAIDTGPFGESTVIWKTLASGNGNGDGGWNSDWYAVDVTKTYRQSVWMRRTSSTAGGTFYLGTNGNTECVYRMDNGTAQCNPYWECSGTSRFTQNQWYLVVGHVHPYGTPNGTGHIDTGIYTSTGGKVMGINGCNVGADCKFGASTTHLRHRTYHYYCGDSTTRLEFAYPRVECVDGNEPSIEELLNGFGTASKNLRNPSQKFFLNNKLRTRTATELSKTSIKKLAFDATNDYLKVDGGTSTSLQRTIEMVVRVNGVNATYMPIAVYTRASGGTESGKRVWLGVQNSRFQMHGWGTNDPQSSSTITDGQWHHVVYAHNASTKYHYMWVNGVLESNLLNTESTGLSGWSNSSDLIWWVGHDPQQAGWTGSASAYFNGDVGIFKTYSKVLSNNEVLRNFRAYKKRFNIG